MVLVLSQEKSIMLKVATSTSDETLDSGKCSTIFQLKLNLKGCSKYFKIPLCKDITQSSIIILSPLSYAAIYSVVMTLKAYNSNNRKKV